MIQSVADRNDLYYIEHPTINLDCKSNALTIASLHQLNSSCCTVLVSCVKLVCFYFRWPGSWERCDWYRSSSASEPHRHVLRGRSRQTLEAVMRWCYERRAGMDRDHLYSCLVTAVEPVLTAAVTEMYWTSAFLRQQQVPASVQWVKETGPFQLSITFTNTVQFY